MRRSVVFAVALTILPATRAYRFHKFAALLNEGISFADYPGYSTISFSLWAQAASSVLLPILDDAKDTPMTILAPSTTAFADYIESKGGNMSDPGALVVGSWQQLWTGMYPYFCPSRTSRLHLWAGLKKRCRRQAVIQPAQRDGGDERARHRAPFLARRLAPPPRLPQRPGLLHSPAGSCQHRQLHSAGLQRHVRQHALSVVAPFSLRHCH